MRSPFTKKFTLMPLIALAGLSLAVTLPALSATQLHAAPPANYATVTVHTGDNLWSLAERNVATGGDVQAVVDQIVAVNHLQGGSLQPGQRIRIPK